MKKLFYITLLLCGFSFVACQNKKAKNPAHLRAISMIQFTPAKIIITGKGKNKAVQETLNLDYAQPSDYHTFVPGYYDITLKVQGKPLLKDTFAFGKNSYYTLLSGGLLPENWKLNPETTMHKLKYIFAGSEARSTNKNLPQWFMLRDNYDGNKNSAYIRLVNANPRTNTIRVKKGKKALKSGLAYPMETSMLKIKPGTQRLHIYYGKVQLGEKEIHTEPGYIYTAFVGSKENAMDSLTVRVLKNPSRTLLKSE